jgi:nucleoside-diphosphate-sugar epimerase
VQRIEKIVATDKTPIWLEARIRAGVREKALGKNGIKNMKPMQAGDVQQTHAATDALHAVVGFTPTTILVDGITQFATWYVPYQSISKSVSSHR